MIRTSGERPIFNLFCRYSSLNIYSFFFILENLSCCCLQGSSAFEEYYRTVSFSVLATKQSKRDSARRWMCCRHTAIESILERFSFSISSFETLVVHIEAKSMYLFL